MWRLLRRLPPPTLTFVKRHTPSKLRFALRQSLGADYRKIPDKVIAAPDGRRFHVGPDPIYWAIHHGLEYEPEASGLIRKLLRPGDVVADVGANIGWYSTLCARAVGDQGHVYAFEPVPSTRARLEENIGLNDMQSRVTVVPKAVAARPGTATIHLFDNQSHALASLSRLGSSAFTAVPVEVTSLDEFVAVTGIDSIDFVKCDVEGAELDVLNGAASLVAGRAAPLILIELNGGTLRRFGHAKGDLMRFLQDAGYEHFFDLTSAQSLRRVQLVRDLDAMDLMLCGKGSEMRERIAGAGISIKG